VSQSAVPADSTGVPSDRATPRSGSWRARLSRATPESVRATLDEDARLRLRLQRRSRSNFRRQLMRSSIRISVLMVADLGAFAVMRTLLRAVRDLAMLGPSLAHSLTTVIPRGALSGWQFAAALIISLVVTGNYGQGDRRRNAARLFLGGSLAVALPLWVEIWARSLPLVFVEYALTTMLVWAGLLAERFTIDRVVGVVRPPEHNASRTIFVGPAKECRAAAASPVFSSGQSYLSLGFVDTSWPAAADAIGCRADLGRLIHEKYAEAIVICGQFDDALFQQVVDTTLSAGCELVSVPRTQNFPGLRPAFVWRDGEPLVALTAPALKGQQLFVKRIADVALGMVGLVVASPVLACVAVAVKLDSRGPVFFSQERVGFGGRRFKIHKFRTMELDAEQRLEEVRSRSLYGDPRLFKAAADPRVTKVGRFLRKSSLDELPQLWNVVKGQMSLVGPRPPLPSEVALYATHHYARFDVKPGITGPWQANGRNEITDFEQVVRLETAYIREWTLWKDLQILARTVPVVLKMRGAH
jgi:exopolysaccharide biosynthesis polyprenyl glycosylphosphotransferase